ncbi:hypothetical protein [Catenulispora rubra]|uniref:hypothetical protein n=1 Tax=Catenulispora rubra TaxID=280293 RepID=UPI0018922F94|nr:hypothetical protein [Catenulispora rubra]
MGSVLSSLHVDVRVSSETGRNGVIVVSAVVHPIVDGRDVVADAFESGPGHVPELLLRPDGLRAGDEPHEVELAEADCTWRCCGALCVTIRRDGGQAARRLAACRSGAVGPLAVRA